MTKNRHKIDDKLPNTFVLNHNITQLENNR